MQEAGTADEVPRGNGGEGGRRLELADLRPRREAGISSGFAALLALLTETDQSVTEPRMTAVRCSPDGVVLYRKSDDPPPGREHVLSTVGETEANLRGWAESRGADPELTGMLLQRLRGGGRTPARRPAAVRVTASYGGEDEPAGAGTAA